jgi:hypothetical protein
MAYHRTEITTEMVGVIKLARARGYKYQEIAAFYVINQGGIADVMKGRIGPEIPAANDLPPGFPKAA